MKQKAPMSIPSSEAEWLALVREGCAGNAAAFQLRLSRLIARLRREKSALTPLLARALTEANSSRLTLARDGAAQQALVSPVDSDSNLALTSIQFPAFLEHEPVWPPKVDEILGGLVNEWRHADRLREAGLSPSRTVLLSGPPGVGKTLAATYLAEQLNFPLITLNLAAAVNSLLGKTGTNLTRVLVHAKVQPCVLLLDEFDALAKRRDDGQDVGELKRVVNVLLQAIDEWPGTSLLVAATNHEELLDRAVFRRFDIWLRFPDSTTRQVEALLSNLGAGHAVSRQIAPAFAGKPLSDASRLVTRARREIAINGGELDDVLIRLALPSATDPAESERWLLVKRLHADGLSTRAIAKHVGVSAATVSRWLHK
ncbi:AAA family ATPase [Dokdonella sp.]|uniref:AAA family ATPase n=1 Tax=Dokdonella sp. TaxID=2291710 RepID=UPI0025B92277|nr:AAA family ATPase [Dokdonella sp.]